MTDERLKPLIDRALPEPLLNMSEAEREEWGQEEPPAAPTLNLGMCTGVGRPMTWNDTYGEWCCPECGGPESIGCWTEDSPGYRAYQRKLAKKAKS